jgi:hypothetical protein
MIPLSTTRMMKAISLWQPWASLWLTERKVHETRHWPTAYRGRLLVHAAKRFVRDVELDLKEILIDEFGGHWGMDLPRGALLGFVDLEDCVPTERIRLTADDEACGDFSLGRFGWRRGRFVRFAQPIPWRGMQALFSVPSNVVAEAMAQAGEVVA